MVSDNIYLISDLTREIIFLVSRSINVTREMIAISCRYCTCSSTIICASVLVSSLLILLLTSAFWGSRWHSKALLNLTFS